MTTRRGTSNTNQRGGTPARRRRKAWLVATFRADVDAWPCSFVGPVYATPVPRGAGVPACRCYRCGALLTAETVTPDRIVPAARGGTYRRSNLRPACLGCQSLTGVEIREALKAERATLGAAS